MALHFAGTPISFMANVHCAAATQNFMALEHHSVDLDYWQDLVTTKHTMIDKGFAPVPDTPGLGVELNEEVVKQHLDPKTKVILSRLRTGILNDPGIDSGANYTISGELFLCFAGNMKFARSLINSSL